MSQPIRNLPRRSDARRTLIGALPALALGTLLVACGEPDDASAPDLEPDLTNVDPREPLRDADAPELDQAVSDGREGASARIESQVDGQIAQPEPDLRATATIEPASESGVEGELSFRQEGEAVSIEGTVSGLEPGPHGFHIHVAGDCSAPDATSAEGHFAPDDDPHGAPSEMLDDHHVGDLGNITADESGTARIDKSDAEMSLGSGENSILGRAVIVHAGRDNLESQPSGDAGARVGCGVVEPAVAQAY